MHLHQKIAGCFLQAKFLGKQKKLAASHPTRPLIA
jgi:hypothetical protein